MQFGCAPHHVILDVGDDGGAVVGAFFGVTLDKAVVHETVETVMAAGSIQSQQVIAQQRQFLLLAERSDVAPGARRTGDGFVSHSPTPRGSPRGGVRIPRNLILCVAPYISSPCVASIFGKIGLMIHSFLMTLWNPVSQHHLRLRDDGDELAIFG